MMEGKEWVRQGEVAVRAGSFFDVKTEGFLCFASGFMEMKSRKKYLIVRN